MQKNMQKNKQKKIISLCLVLALMISQVQSVVYAVGNTSIRTYEMSVGLWHATKDSQSMAKDALTGTGTLVKENGEYRIYINTQEALIMGFTGYMESMEVEQEDGSYIEAAIESKDEQDRPSEFSFAVDELKEFYTIKAAIITSLMPMNQSARIRVLNLEEIATQIEIEEAEERGDLSKVVNGTYEIPVDLWHETSDKASMASSAVKSIARIAIRDGVATMYIYTQPMNYGSLVASLQELKILMLDGTYQNATVTMTSENGDPVGFSFELPSYDQFVGVLVNPKIAMMGNADIGARLKMDYTGVKKIADDTDMKQDPNPTVEPEITPEPEATKAPETTTPEPEATKAPETTTPEPEATKTPETSTPEPETTTPTPNTTQSPQATTAPTTQSTTQLTTQTTTDSATQENTTQEDTTQQDVTIEEVTQESPIIDITPQATQSQSTTTPSTQYTIIYTRSIGTKFLTFIAGFSVLAFIGTFLWDKKKEKGNK